MRFGVVVLAAFAAVVARAGLAAEPAPARDSLLAAANAESAAGSSVAPAGAKGLEATSDVPWNPSGPVSRRRPWEQALLLPGRIVSLPLSGLGYVANHTLLYLEKSALVEKVSFVARALPERAGISLKPASLGGRTGLGATVGLHMPFLGGVLKNRLRADFSLTTREYTRTRLSVLGRPGHLEYGFDWRPQERFRGVGLESSEFDLSGYASQSEFARGTLHWGWNRDADHAPPRTQVDLWGGPRTMVTRTGREEGKMSYEDRFPALGALTLDRRVDHLIYGGRFSSDWRRGEQRWIAGWRVLLSAERYDRPIKLIALRTGRPDGAQFTRYQGETETGFSFMRDPRSVRLLVRLTDQRVTSGADHFLLPDMATLGGRAGLAGFEPRRFHDLDLLLTKITYIFPLVRRLEMEVHSEWGGVYADVWNQAKLSTLRNSFGVALRGRLRERPFGLVGVDFSRESVRVRFSLGGVE